jgi:hypothetical protein
MRRLDNDGGVAAARSGGQAGERAARGRTAWGRSATCGRSSAWGGRGRRRGLRRKRRRGGGGGERGARGGIVFG